MINPDLLRSASARLLVGYSGGLDSSVLLHALCQAARALGIDRNRIVGLHINHGAQPQAAQWEAFCARQCAQLDVGYLSDTVEVPVGASFEAEARRVRYRAFAAHLHPGDWLLLAHQGTDQAETLLLNLLRGAALDGLSAMPERRRFGAGCLVRPLLRSTRAELHAWAQQRDIAWIEDSSNKNEVHSRNYLRHSVVPHIARRWSAWEQVLGRTSEVLGRQRLILEQLLQERLRRLTGIGGSLNLSGLLAQGDALAAELVRLFIRSAQQPLPNSAQLAELLSQCHRAAVDTRVLVDWSRDGRRTALGLYRGRLWLLPQLAAHPQGLSGHWSPQRQTRLQLGAVVLSGHRAPGGLRLLVAAQVRVRFRGGGERMRLHRGHSRPLKKLLQEAGIPPWLRARVPLLYLGRDLVAVPGVGIASPYRSQIQGWHCSVSHTGGEFFLSTDRCDAEATASGIPGTTGKNNAI